MFVGWSVVGQGCIPSGDLRFLSFRWEARYDAEVSS